MTEKNEFGQVEKTPLPKISEQMRADLRADFPPEAYSKHPTKTFLTTLKAMYVVERLNDVFGLGRWTIQHKVESYEHDYVLMSGRLSLLDYDCVIPQQYGGHATAGKNTEKADGYKSAITDMLSKCASYLEIGIDVFKGKVSGNGGSNQHGAGSGKGPADGKPSVERVITVDEVNTKWNGKIYWKAVFINNEKIIPPIDQLQKLKAHPNYIPSEKK